jgi:hypothetical protein
VRLYSFVPQLAVNLTKHIFDHARVPTRTSLWQNGKDAGRKCRASFWFWKTHHHQRSGFWRLIEVCQQLDLVVAEISFRFVNQCQSNKPTTSNNAQQLSPFRQRSRLCAVVGSVINSLLCGYIWA